MTTTTVSLPLPDAPGAAPRARRAPGGPGRSARRRGPGPRRGGTGIPQPGRCPPAHPDPGPDGRLAGAGGPRSPVLMIRDQDAFCRRLGSGTAGLAEAYMTRARDCDDLPGLFTVLASNVTTLVPAPLRALRRWYIPRQPAAEDATIKGARRNIQRHYDPSDDLFERSVRPRRQPRRRAAPQDRCPAGPHRGGPGDLSAGDRHRLGRAGHPRRPGHHRHHLTITVAYGPPPRRSHRRRRRGGRAIAGLPKPSAATTWCSAWK
jgi:hypothetical protein